MENSGEFPKNIQQHTLEIKTRQGDTVTAPVQVEDKKLKLPEMDTGPEDFMRGEGPIKRFFRRTKIAIENKMAGF